MIFSQPTALPSWEDAEWDTDPEAKGQHGHPEAPGPLWPQWSYHFRYLEIAFFSNARSVVLGLLVIMTHYLWWLFYLYFWTQIPKLPSAFVCLRPNTCYLDTKLAKYWKHCITFLSQDTNYKQSLENLLQYKMQDSKLGHHSLDWKIAKFCCWDLE